MCERKLTLRFAVSITLLVMVFAIPALVVVTHFYINTVSASEAPISYSTLTIFSAINQATWFIQCLWFPGILLVIPFGMAWYGGRGFVPFGVVTLLILCQFGIAYMLLIELVATDKITHVDSLTVGTDEYRLVSRINVDEDSLIELSIGLWELYKCPDGGDLCTRVSIESGGQNAEFDPQAYGIRLEIHDNTLQVRGSNWVQGIALYTIGDDD